MWQSKWAIWGDIITVWALRSAKTLQSEANTHLIIRLGFHSVLIITACALILLSQISIYSEAGGSGKTLTAEACPTEISRLIRILMDGMLIKDSRCGNNHFELKQCEKNYQERDFLLLRFSLSELTFFEGGKWKDKDNVKLLTIKCTFTQPFRLEFSGNQKCRSISIDFSYPCENYLSVWLQSLVHTLAFISW